MIANVRVTAATIGSIRFHKGSRWGTANNRSPLSPWIANNRFKFETHIGDGMPALFTITHKTTPEEFIQSWIEISRQQLQIHMALNDRRKHVGHILTLKRCWPVSISNNTHPNANTSLR